MVSLVAKTISIGDKTVPIERFEVWFTTPFGLTDKYDEAVDVARSRDLDIELSVRPVAVAVGPDNIYEVVS